MCCSCLVMLTWILQVGDQSFDLFVLGDGEIYDILSYDQAFDFNRPSFRQLWLLESSAVVCLWDMRTMHEDMTLRGHKVQLLVQSMLASLPYKKLLHRNVCFITWWLNICRTCLVCPSTDVISSCRFLEVYIIWSTNNLACLDWTRSPKAHRAKISYFPDMADEQPKTVNKMMFKATEIIHPHYTSLGGANVQNCYLNTSRHNNLDLSWRYTQGCMQAYMKENTGLQNVIQQAPYTCFDCYSENCRRKWMAPQHFFL